MGKDVAVHLARQHGRGAPVFNRNEQRVYGPGVLFCIVELCFLEYYNNTYCVLIVLAPFSDEEEEKGSVPVEVEDVTY